MSLSDKQWTFLINVSKLIQFIKSNGMKATGGELLRTMEQQQIYLKEGRSKTLDSQHLRKLAIDMNFFNGGTYLMGLPRDELKPLLQEVGDYWESLGDGYQWGGNWNFWDPGHFQG